MGTVQNMTRYTLVLLFALAISVKSAPVPNYETLGDVAGAVFESGRQYTSKLSNPYRDLGNGWINFFERQSRQQFSNMYGSNTRNTAERLGNRLAQRVDQEYQVSQKLEKFGFLNDLFQFGKQAVFGENN